MDCTFFGESTGLYFYSAVFQGNVALLGLMAVFYVFLFQQYRTKVQYLENLIYETCDYMRQFLPNQSRSLRGASDSDIKRFLSTYENDLSAAPVSETMISESSLKKYCAQVATYVRLRNSARGDLNNLFGRIKRPLVLTTILIVWSLVLLPFAYRIHVRSLTNELVFFLVTIMFNIYTLFLSSRFIYKTIKFGTRYGADGVPIHAEDDDEQITLLP